MSSIHAHTPRHPPGLGLGVQSDVFLCQRSLSHAPQLEDMLTAISAVVETQLTLNRQTQVET